MSTEPSFRFVHASNLALDRTCFAVGDLPPDLRSDLISAPFLAAERVFDVAVRERVDFVLLAGGLFHSPIPSTWGARFLSLQCEQLRGCGIPVYWAEASHDVARFWPPYIPFPANLFLADTTAGQQYLLDTASGPRVLIETVADPDTVGRCSPRRSRADFPFRIAVVPSCSVPASLPEQPVHYWAIQGGARPQTIPVPRGTALTAGTPQGRTPDDIDAGGCRLVTVTGDHEVSARFVETNRIRWREEVLTTDASTNWEGFRRLAHSRMDAICRGSAAEINFVRWTIRGHGPVVERLTRPDVVAAMQSELRSAFGVRRPAAWSMVLSAEADVVLDSQWRTHTGDIGEFIRALDDLAPREAPAGAGHAVLSGPHFASHVKSAARRHGLQVLAEKPR
jgi:exonuclease SbcD